MMGWNFSASPELQAYKQYLPWGVKYMDRTYLGPCGASGYHKSGLFYRESRIVAC